MKHHLPLPQQEKINNYLPVTYFNPKHFWNWFQDNFWNKIYPHQQEEYKTWLKVHLQYYCRELQFKLEIDYSNYEKNKLYISCMGNPLYFPAVSNLIDHAPKMSRWEFVALIPQLISHKEIIQGKDPIIHMEGYGFQVSQFHFYPVEVNSLKQLSIILYIKNWDQLQNKEKATAKLLEMLTEYLGEVKLFHILHQAEVRDFTQTENLNEAFFHISEVTDTHQYLCRKLS